MRVLFVGIRATLCACGEEVLLMEQEAPYVSVHVKKGVVRYEEVAGGHGGRACTCCM